MFSKAELSIEADGKSTGEKLPIGTFGPISIHPDFKRQEHRNLFQATSMELKQLTLPHN